MLLVSDHGTEDQRQPLRQGLPGGRHEQQKVNARKNTYSSNADHNPEVLNICVSCRQREARQKRKIACLTENFDTSIGKREAEISLFLVEMFLWLVRNELIKQIFVLISEL